MSKNISNKALLKWFIKEEFRVFETLFGAKRLLMFPAVLFVLSILLGASIPAFGVSMELSVMVLMVLVALFGLQTGSIGFEARDTLDDLMGDSSRILFSSRTLPISQKRLAGLFLLKDAVVYSGFMILPIFAGVLVGIVMTPLSFATATITVPLVLMTYGLVILSFLFGVSAGFVLTTMSYSNLKGLLGSAIIGVVMIPIVYVGYTQPEFFTGSSVMVVAAGMMALIAIFTSLGLWQFNITNNQKKQSQHSNWFGSLSDSLPKTSRMQILIKTGLDIIRSPGGSWKIFFSTGVISVTVVFLVEVVREFMITGVSPAFLYAGLFALSVFPIYTLVYRYDSDEYYSSYPITQSDVRVAKSLAYVVLSTVIVGTYYTVAMVLSSATVVSYVTGLFVMVSMIIYQLGIFLLVARDEPLKFLFNGMMFSGYSFSLLLVMIPLAMVGLYGAVIPAIITDITLGICALCLLIGLGLARFAILGDS